MARARAYKAPRDLNRTPPRTLDLTGAQTHRRLPVHGVSAAARSPCHRRPANQALPNPVQPSERTEHTSVKLPERGIEVCFAGEASPRSPDSTRPLASVDWVILCAILQFLVHTASTSPREAHRAIGLNQVAVVWPAHHRRREHPPAHVDRAIPATPTVKPYTAVTARASPSQPRPSPDLSRRR
jgi:hypothetical protein